MMRRVYFHEWASLSHAGDNEGYRRALFADSRLPLGKARLVSGEVAPFGSVDESLIFSEADIIARFPDLTADPLLRWGRGNRIAATLFGSLKSSLTRMIEAYGADRVALVIGTSVAGMTETEAFFLGGKRDECFRDTDLEMYNPVRALRALSGIKGPAYAISTACSSSTKALIAAARLIKSGAVDAALCGGMDAKSLFTLSGFHALSALSLKPTQPFGEHREGINLGEGGALFLLSREPSEYELAGWGETSDAYHISSPDPEAHAVKAAVSHAFKMADVSSVDFVCAHGTGTVKNDKMEASVIHDLAPNAWVSSPKAITGHTLGGAGALCVAAALIGLREKRLPAHLIDDTPDPRLAKIKLALQSVSMPTLNTVLCNSFAFGGNNAVLLIKRVAHATDKP